MDSQKKKTLIKRLSIGGCVVGLIVFLVYLDAYYFPTIPTRIIISGLTLLAVWEVFRMLEKLGSPNAIYWGIVPSAVVLYYAGSHFFDNLILVILLGAPGAFFLLARAFHTRTGLLFGLMLVVNLYVVLPMSCLIQIRSPEPDNVASLGGLPGVVFVVTVSKVGDIFAYFVGSFLGKHKLAPKISPNKTWEGSVASFLGATGIAVLFVHMQWLPGLEIKHGLILGMAMNVAAQCADLSKSILKRTAGVKDSGTYFSVMGGALDMIDSLIFAAPTYVALRNYWIP